MRVKLRCVYIRLDKKTLTSDALGQRLMKCDDVASIVADMT